MPTNFSMWNANLNGPGAGGRGVVRNNVVFYSFEDHGGYVNIIDMSHELPTKITNRLLVKHSGGLFMLDDPNAQQAFGEIVEDYLTVDIADRLQAEEQAMKHLRDYNAGLPAVTVSLQPTGTNDVPYIDFNVGDWVLAPMAPIGHGSYRVIGITITGDDEGNASVVVELNRRSFSAEQQRQSLFQTLGSGVVGTAPPSEKVDGFKGSGD